MTVATIPVFPGDLGTHTDQAPAVGTYHREAYVPKHRAQGRARKPNRRKGAVDGSTARRRIAQAAVATSALVGAALTLAATPAHASAAGHSSLWWDTATCRAFATWERHQTWPRFEVMVRDAKRADPYLKVDVGLLNGAEVAHAPRTVRVELETFVWADCNTSGD